MWFSIDEIFGFLVFYTAKVGSLLVMFWDNLSGPSSRVKQSKKDAGNTYIRIYIGNDVGNDWFSENLIPSNRVSGS